MKLGKTYSPKDYESNIYDLWESNRAFAPTGKGEPFSMVMPPPNANASLHIGHVLGFSIQDTIIRYMRMNGRDTVWLPGADHAGFETQVVFEKHLAKEGKSRFDLSRDELYRQIYAFVDDNRGNFNEIFRKLGASCDWDSFTFSLDERSLTAAYRTFKKLWDDGLIYRGERLVNYCTQHRTSFADIEVEYEDRTTPLYYLKYGPFILATTRPETKFGDTAVAVHPDDERYKEFVGKVITVEGVNGPFTIQVIADEMVDRQFGTGVVKITPAHDLNDWEVAQRHNLPAVRVINHDGTLNHHAGRFEGLTVTEGRKAVVAALKELNLLEKVDEKYRNRVGVCYRCGTVIEPMLMDQWFIKMKELAAPAIAALKAKQITFYPETKCEQTIEYLEQVRDWNISRQIAWGIPIPAFQNINDSDEWIFDERVDQELLEIDGKTYRRDTDVFDTWFSSGQWPLITTGYPDEEDAKKYYPTTLMETGVDILYQWVARMIVLGHYVSGEVPFKEVYLHGMVRAEDGHKMSKSLGNVVDPAPLIDEFGTDAVRLGMMSGRSAGYSAAFAPAKVVAGRNFCNKLWNISRYIEGVLDGAVKTDDAIPATPADHWVLSRLQQYLSEYARLMSEYRLSETYELLYHFVWDDVADWYIEASKMELNPALLRYLLDCILKSGHPFAPFVTETIWQTLEWTGDSLLISQHWPKAMKFDHEKAGQFEEIKTIVSETRTIVSTLALRKTHLYFTDVPFLSEHAALIASLARIDGAQEVTDGRGLHLTTTTHTCWLDIDKETAERYLEDLQRQLDEANQKAATLQARLNNSAYMKKAPKALVRDSKQQLEATKLIIANTQQQIQRFTTLAI